jgi:hypothetical protein
MSQLYRRSKMGSNPRFFEKNRFDPLHLLHHTEGREKRSPGSYIFQVPATMILAPVTAAAAFEAQ